VTSLFSEDNSFSDNIAFFKKKKRSRAGVKTMLKEAYFLAYPRSAICVQRFDDSLNSAIRITYRISLRSSSLREPRYPLLRVVLMFRKKFLLTQKSTSKKQFSSHKEKHYRNGSIGK
jgi:hypothetical protein